MGDGVLVEQYLLEEAKAEQHELGVVRQQFLHLVGWDVIDG